MRRLTFLSYLVKDFNLLQVDSKTGSHGYGFCGIIFVTPSDGPIGMCSAKRMNMHDQHSLMQIKPVTSAQDNCPAKGKKLTGSL